MAKRSGLRSRRTGLPLDFLLPTMVALLTILGMVVTDYALEVDVLSRAEEEDGTPGGPGGKQTIEVETESQSGYTNEGSTTEVDLGELPENVTRIMAELSWQDDIGSNDVLRLTLFHNGSELASSEGSTGQLNVESDDGWYTGEYGVEITAVNCPGIIDIGPDLRDTGNAWDLTVSVMVEVEE